MNDFLSGDVVEYLNVLEKTTDNLAHFEKTLTQRLPTMGGT
jgi:hypothetical protein